MIKTKNLIHPGKILSEEFLKSMHISRNNLVMDIHISASRINTIIKETRVIPTGTALRLGKYFGSGPEFRSNLQSNYDLRVAAVHAEKELEKIPQ